MSYDKETAKAIQCAGRLLELCTCDPDPEAQDKYTGEFNCAACDNHRICCTVLESVEQI